MTILFPILLGVATKQKCVYITGCGDIVEIEHKKLVGSWESNPSCAKLEGIDLKREVISANQRRSHLSPLTPSIQGQRYGPFDERAGDLI